MFENITSLAENYKGKIRNPFIGTIISVWIFHNWILIYSLFNFDDKATLHDKLIFIADYFILKSFWYELWFVIGFALFILVLTFILLAISRVITDTYYKIIEPFFTTLIDKNSILTYEEKLKLEKKIEELNRSLDSKRQEISRAEGANQIVINNRDKLQTEYDTYRKITSEEISKQKIQIDSIKINSANAYKVVEYFENIINGFNDSMRNELKIFIEHEDNIKVNAYVNFVGLRSELLKLGILLPSQNGNKITELGKLFLDYYKLQINDFKLEKL